MTMITTHPSSFGKILSHSSAIGHRIQQIVQFFQSKLKRYRTINQLRALDGRTLKDIGVSPYDLNAIEHHKNYMTRIHFQGLVGTATRQSFNLAAAIALGASIFAGAGANAGASFDCASLPNHAVLQAALDTAVNAEDSGLDLQMWATVVDRDGIVCAVAHSGNDRGAQWPGSRVISAQKANTANAFSLDGLALSTANLFSAVQPGGSLFGLQLSNPVNTDGAYKGPAKNFGRAGDPMVGNVIGGVNVFGGGLGLYDDSGVIGAIGLSGDTSCADHMIAWRVRHELGLDQLVSAGAGGVSGDNMRPDNIVFDISANPTGGTGLSAGGFGHPECINTGDPQMLPAVR